MYCFTYWFVRICRLAVITDTRTSSFITHRLHATTLGTYTLDPVLSYWLFIYITAAGQLIVLCFEIPVSSLSTRTTSAMLMTLKNLLYFTLLQYSSMLFLIYYFLSLSFSFPQAHSCKLNLMVFLICLLCFFILLLSAFGKR